jgi:phosphonatase-like hydrolase
VKPEFIAFDVAGTTVNDDGLVMTAFKKAFEKSQPEAWPLKGAEWTQYALDTMGQSKIEVFTHLLGDREKAHMANLAFEEAYVNAISESGANPITGTHELFDELRSQNIGIVLTTGFSRSTLDVLLSELAWEKIVDLSVTPDEAGRGRPNPDMLNYAAMKFEIKSKEDIIVVGDTASDMLAGVAFGSLRVIGVLSGAHKEEALLSAGATSVIHSVANLSTLI